MDMQFIMTLRPPLSAYLSCCSSSITGHQFNAPSKHNLKQEHTQLVVNILLILTRSRPKLNYGAGRDFGVGPELGATRKQPIIPGNSRARSCADEEDRVT